MNREIHGLIFRLLDQTITEQEFERLQDAIEQDEEVRGEYLRAVAVTDLLGELSTQTSPEPNRPPADDRVNLGRRTSRLGQIAIAASVLALVSGTAFWIGRNNAGRRPTEAADAPTTVRAESQLAGHATLRRTIDLRWSNAAQPWREGDVLANGPLEFDAGVAEIDFFCGATLIVEGPARLDIESDWAVSVSAGRLRASVPPAARGFVVKAAGSEIVDLGTEFALDVGPDNARVEVIDGEVELRGGKHDGEHLVTGESTSLKGEDERDNVFAGLSTVPELQRRRDVADSKRFREWQDYSHQLRSDPRLIAYYPILEMPMGRLVPNESSLGSSFHGRLVGSVDRTAGRFGPQSTGLAFSRPGARVRTRIDGEYQAFTFASWVRIVSLEHRYNALFMGDGYENGEPHWQIRDDGSLMFSVMVDDSQEIRSFNEREQRVVNHAGLHHVYMSRPFWDISKSGQWFHLAAVYDPAARQVKQYVNGDEISRETIVDKFYIRSLRIGPAEIGNWGQPFRKSAWFAVRNLNGTIDEMTIFNAPLTGQEISELYQQGKPLGH